MGKEFKSQLSVEDSIQNSSEVPTKTALKTDLPNVPATSCPKPNADKETPMTYRVVAYGTEKLPFQEEPVRHIADIFETDRKREADLRVQFYKKEGYEVEVYTV